MYQASYIVASNDFDISVAISVMQLSYVVCLFAWLNEIRNGCTCIDM